MELVPLQERMDSLLATLFQQAEAAPTGKAAGGVSAVRSDGRRVGDSGELMKLLKLFKINWPRRVKKLPEHEPMRCPTPLFLWGEESGQRPHKLTVLAHKFEMMGGEAGEK